MKKTYIKPKFGIDLFTVAQSIAATCEVNHDAEMGYPLQEEKTTCGWYMDDTITVFLIGSSFCSYQIKDGDPETYCYNNPYGATEIFGS